MSWRGSIRYWELRPFSYHVYMHALDPKQRRFHDIGIGRREWQIWPPRAVLNPDNEWTLPSRADLIATIEHCVQLLEKHPQ